MLSIFSCAYWPSIFLLWRNVSLGLLPIFQLVLLLLLMMLLSCMSYLYILKIKLLLVMSFTNIFSHSAGCLFILFIIYFAVKKLVSLVQSHLFIFSISILLGGWSKKILVWFMSGNIFHILSSRSFMLSCPMFKSLCHFEFILFLCMVWEWVLTSLIYMSVQLSQHDLLRRWCFSFPIVYS